MQSFDVAGKTAWHSCSPLLRLSVLMMLCVARLRGRRRHSLVASAAVLVVTSCTTISLRLVAVVMLINPRAISMMIHTVMMLAFAAVEGSLPVIVVARLIMPALRIMLMIAVLIVIAPLIVVVTLLVTRLVWLVVKQLLPILALQLMVHDRVAFLLGPTGEHLAGSMVSARAQLRYLVVLVSTVLVFIQLASVLHLRHLLGLVEFVNPRGHGS